MPPAEELGELRAVSGRSDKLTYKEWFGRVVLDETLNINLAGLLYRYHDMRVGAGSGSGKVFDADNVDVDGHGAESDLTWRPTRRLH